MQFLNAIDLSGIGTTNPSADIVRIYKETEGGRQMIGFRDETGWPTIVQPHFGLHRIASWIPQGGSVTITATGSNALTAAGTATAVTVAATNVYTQSKCLEYLVTAAANNAVAGFRASQNTFWRGNATDFGGFHMVCRWGPATGVATTTNRAFVGMTSSTAAPTDVQPSSLLSMCGMGWDAADTNIQIMTNDGTGTATKTDLGASFPVPTVDRSKVYELQLYCAPNASTMSYKVTDVGTGSVASGTLSTDLIPNTTFISPRGWMSVGGTSSVIGIALMNMYVETMN